MTYKETIDYLYAALPMFSRIGDAAIKKDLTNTLILCERLHNPQQRFKSIHVAGTNGKGSVSHMLAAVLQSCGYKTGLYTSPHLKDFRERIKVNGEMITEEAVVRFTEGIIPAINEIQPSFFEITVAMAFNYFAEQEVEFAVIETGLGGRLDSTNIIMPELSVITNIGMDHMHILGDTLELIAREKAGIIKQNVPVVIGTSHPQTSPIFAAMAIEKNAPIVFADTQRYVDEYVNENHALKVTVVDTASNEKQVINLDLTGIYQTKNLITVLAAINELKKREWNLDEKDVLYGLRHAKRMTGLHGRWEVIHHNPTVVLDVAHNEDGIKQLTDQIEFTDYHNLHIVIGMVKDKEIEKIMTLLPKEATYYFTKAPIPRAMPEEQLALIAREHNLKGHHYADVNTALTTALDHSNADDLIVVCGSVFVVGEVKGF